MVEESVTGLQADSNALGEQAPDSSLEASEMKSIKAATALDPVTEALILKRNLSDNLQSGDMNLAELQMYKMGLVDEHGNPIESFPKQSRDQDADTFLKELTAPELDRIDIDDPSIDPSLKAAILHWRHKKHQEEAGVEYEKPPEIIPEERTVTAEVAAPPVSGKESEKTGDMPDFAVIAALAASMASQEPLHQEFAREVEARGLQPETADGKRTVNADLISEKGIDFSALSSIVASMRGMGIRESRIADEEKFTPTPTNVVKLDRPKVASVTL